MNYANRVPGSIPVGHLFGSRLADAVVTQRLKFRHLLILLVQSTLLQMNLQPGQSFIKNF